LKRGAPNHRKTKRLARALGLPHYSAVGLLECLFHLAASQAQDGNIGRFEDDEIAAELGWTGDAATTTPIKPCRAYLQRLSLRFCTAMTMLAPC
jgi:hypothetical protein